MSGMMRTVTAAVVTGVAALALSTFAAPAPAHADPLIGAPLGAFDGACDKHCRTCGTNKHDIVVHYSTNKHQSPHLENCQPGPCSDHNCGQTVASRVTELWNQLQVHEGTALRELLEHNADIATYNPDRGAVQFRCDKGNLVANLPLAATQIESLTSSAVLAELFLKRGRRNLHHGLRRPRFFSRDLGIVGADALMES